MYAKVYKWVGKDFAATAGPFCIHYAMLIQPRCLSFYFGSILFSSFILASFSSSCVCVQLAAAPARPFGPFVAAANPASSLLLLHTWRITIRPCSPSITIDTRVWNWMPSSLWFRSVLLLFFFFPLFFSSSSSSHFLFNIFVIYIRVFHSFSSPAHNCA